MLQVAALSDDAIVIPVIGLDLSLDLGGFTDFARDFDLRLVRSSAFLDDGLLAALSQDAATFFFIEDTRVGLARFEVGLVAGHHKRFLVGELGAVLDAGITSDDLVLKGELEVSDLVLVDEEGVTLGGLLLGRTARDATVFDGPEVEALPAGQVLAVEEVLVLGESRRGEREEREEGGVEFHLYGIIWCGRRGGACSSGPSPGYHRGSAP